MSADDAEKPLSNKHRLLGGALCLVLVIVAWIAQAQLLHTVGNNGGWNKPYQVKHSNTLLYTHTRNPTVCVLRSS